ncbi:type II toxin-antitoxin system PemK/MazF family toxin [Candidatus Giovannonibacteria bacterium]|nr:type II toxin-antitoxin system PemK/MazF family toxin [Candidatus Giovannonibacteria bacterium]
MEKDFQNWHNKKSNIDKIEKRPFFHEREIWFCYLGANIGFEQDGSGEEFLRPVLIVRKFNNEIFWGIPLTKAHKKLAKKAEKYYFSFSFISDIKSAAILSQIRLIDARRLSRHIGIMPDAEFIKLIEKLKALLP